MSVSIKPLIRESLTDREREVLVLRGLGKSNREISEFLEISGKTLAHYISNASRKLDVPAKNLRAYVVERGWV